MNYNIMDESEIISEISKIDEQVKKELNKQNVDNNKVYQLRFQQLMKGIYLTQNPYNV